MRNFAIFGRQAAQALGPGDICQPVNIDGVDVLCGIAHTKDPDFQPESEAHARSVLVRVKAFSLNYRDKSSIFRMTVLANQAGFYVTGSEFAGEVVAVGHAVTRFQPGDRVMSNNAYPVTSSPEARPGVPTNHGSKELQILHEAKLARMPDNMAFTTGAAFPIGAQTCYSMVRRLQVREGMNVLVTSAKSNTSLFAINALRRRGANIWATSTSNRFEKELKELGVRELCIVDTRKERFSDHPVLLEMAQQGGFDAVIDPFFDLHLSPSLDILAMGGSYITCGLYDQYLQMIGKDTPGAKNTGSELLLLLMKNLHVIGNCIGLDSDLEDAAADYAAGRLPVVVDSVFTGSRLGAFLDRTYNAPERFGKVVYEY